MEFPSSSSIRAAKGQDLRSLMWLVGSQSFGFRLGLHSQSFWLTGLNVREWGIVQQHESISHIISLGFVSLGSSTNNFIILYGKAICNSQ